MSYPNHPASWLRNIWMVHSAYLVTLPCFLVVAVWDPLWTCKKIIINVIKSCLEKLTNPKKYHNGSEKERKNFSFAAFFPRCIVLQSQRANSRINNRHVGPFFPIHHILLTSFHDFVGEHFWKIIFFSYPFLPISWYSSPKKDIPPLT